MVNTEVLEDLGLSNAQIKIYLSLLELGQTTSGPIIKDTGLQNSVVYNALNQLIEKGLVSFILKGKRKHFRAEDPKSLIAFIDDKKDKVLDLVKQLSISKTEKKQDATVFVGWKGLRTAFDQVMDELPTGSDYIAFTGGVEDQYKEEVKQFFRELQKKRSTKHYKIRLIANKSAKEQVKSFGYYPMFGKPKYRFVPGFAPVGVTIFKNKVLNFAFEETPIAVITTSESIAKSYNNFFEAMWKIAKP
jgi:HTH-type transcriptional regulator, sugar sensing transcriptional regulator